MIRGARSEAISEPLMPSLIAFGPIPESDLHCSCAELALHCASCMLDLPTGSALLAHHCQLMVTDLENVSRATSRRPLTPR